MEYTTLALLAVLAYAVYRYLRKRCDYFEDLGLPYVPALPLFGNMGNLVFGRKHIVHVIQDIYNYMPEAKYLGAFDFTRPVIVVRDPELIKDITIKHFNNFTDHQGFVDVSVDPMFGGNLFSMAGDQWKEARTLLSPAFTSSKMKAMYGLMVKSVENLVAHVEKLHKEDPKRKFATKDLMTKYTNDVIATCAFGIEVNSLEDPTNQFYVLGRKATDFEGLLSLKFSLNRAFPKLMKLLRVKIVTDKVARFFKDVVRRTVEMRDAENISRPDMIQLMMDARGKTSENLKLDITQMTAQAFVFFFGGFDTTSTQMCIISHELIINPDIQSRLQAEIDEVLERTRGKPTYDDINSMPYLDAVYNESMRCHPQANVIDRVCIKAFELPPALPGAKPFVIRPGMNIWVPVAGIHYDEQFHRDPWNFDPDRYLNKKVTISEVENVGFGIGPRSCIGNRFAILETKILFFHLLAKFSLRPNEKTCKNFEYSKNNISIMPKGGYWCSFESRA
ncbi:cytochrome P450 9e2 [Nasonia vitripennis]|uniref:Cytochrome P450 n=1 Tax=Nasonia vitripennis TaxID=7425 RepID=A0A7M7G8X3_NASVI|nr:cytochrome P450 9e2 [Nasonia vitripennis]